MAGTTGITNIYLYNKYINSVNTLGHEELGTNIDLVNNLIEKKCARNFGSDTYKEWVEASSMSYVVLNNYPITKVKLVSLNSVDYLTVEGSNVSLATVSSNNSSVVLSTIATDGSTETEDVLNFASYSNVSSMVSAINLLTNWDAETLSGYDDKITALMRPIDTDWALDQKVYLSGPHLGSKASISYDTESSVLDLGSDFWDDCRWGNRSDSFVNKYVFVWYTAGYTLPICSESGGTLDTSGNVPKGLTLIANAIIKDYIDSRDEDRNMREEEQGDYKFKRDDMSSAIDRHWHDLNVYARKSV